MGKALLNPSHKKPILSTEEKRRKKISIKKSEFGGKIIGGSAGGAVGGIGGAALGGTIGAVGGPIGSAIGSATGAALGGFAGNKLGSLVGGITAKSGARHSKMIARKTRWAYRHPQVSSLGTFIATAAVGGGIAAGAKGGFDVPAKTSFQGENSANSLSVSDFTMLEAPKPVSSSYPADIPQAPVRSKAPHVSQQQQIPT